MKIINKGSTIDTQEESLVFLFEDDNEISSMINRLISMPVKTTGNRILRISPESNKSNKLSQRLMSVIDSLDGIFGENNDQIINNAISDIQDIKRDYYEEDNN